MARKTERGRGKPAREPRKPGTGARRGTDTRARGRAEPSPAAAMRVARLEQVKVMAHPLRLRMLHLFGETPRTAKQVAAILGEKPTRLYHHVDAMARVGLIELVETRQVRGATEKYYRTAARRFEVHHDAAAGGARSADTVGMIRTVVEAARDEAIDYFSGRHGKPPVSPVVVRARIQGSAEELEDIRRALMKVLELHTPQKRRAAKEAEPATLQYTLSILLHPVPEE